ncbi:hypothetical protein TNCT_238211 [Trichonephila clavata]|uniref:Uncharacterized protein n=1 Tax=Trichonephila clavata TaxID=2740835 RepID=A0A8X6L7S6_TRICU|nr:hypothetical protein TNCT_238211 [Trichonephila clavata]
MEEQKQFLNEKQEKSDEDMKGRKGLSRDSSKVPLISADDKMYEEKEETPIDVILNKAKNDINPGILSKETLDLENDENEEEKFI